MEKPLSENKGFLTFCKIFSDFFNPFTSLFLYFVYYSYRHINFSQSLKVFLPLLCIIILPISLWIFIHVKTGKYTNMDVSNRKQRKSLYIFSGFIIVIYLLYSYYIRGFMDWVVLFVGILLVLLQISNFFIKSSMHTAFNVFVAALFYMENAALGIIWLIIAAIVGSTRVILKRHTSQEVFSGAAIAFLVSVIYIIFMKDWI